MPVVNETDVESWLIVGALEGFMPLPTDLGLVVKQDGVTVGFESHGVALKIEVEFCEGHDVLVRLAGPPHVVE